MHRNGKTLFDTRTMVFLGLMVAVQIVLSRFLSIDLAWCRISFGPVSSILAGLWFGPVCGGTCGMLADVLGCLLKYGYQPAYIPITIGMMLWGVIPALFRPLLNGGNRKKGFYICLGIFLSSIVGTLGFSTLGNSILYGTSFWAMLLTRLPQWCLTMPLYCVLTCALYFSPLTKVVRDMSGQKELGQICNS